MDTFRSPLRLCSSLVGCYLAVLVATGLGVSAPAEGQVQIKTLDDGTQLIFNESKAQRARRQSTKLLPVPASSGLEPLIHRAAIGEGLAPRLVQAVVQVESGYNPKALSAKGAMGLMQLMPATAELLRVRDPWDPASNLEGGARYLRQQIDRFGDLALALAAYNAGPTAVDRFGGIPPYAETENYVRKVLGLYDKNPPELLRVQARQEAREYEARIAEQRRAEPRGAKVYLTRDENNRLVFTTSPPDRQ